MVNWVLKNNQPGTWYRHYGWKAGLSIAFPLVPPYYETRFCCGVNGMKPSIALAANREAIRRVVESHRARNARVFGSVIHGDDTEDSDLDILIDPTPETTLFDIGAIRHELLQLLGVPVDVLTPKALPEKFRAVVLAEAVPV
ncbi:nucleotidyltransferase family protein [Photorhabdus namnaonensis]|nr:nucleotidyltransferase family protein [Photorhabdus namnaonensis]